MGTRDVFDGGDALERIRAYSARIVKRHCFVSYRDSVALLVKNGIR